MKPHFPAEREQSNTNKPPRQVSRERRRGGLLKVKTLMIPGAIHERSPRLSRSTVRLEIRSRWKRCD